MTRAKRSRSRAAAGGSAAEARGGGGVSLTLQRQLGRGLARHLEGLRDAAAEDALEDALLEHHPLLNGTVAAWQIDGDRAAETVERAEELRAELEGNTRRRQARQEAELAELEGWAGGHRRSPLKRQRTHEADAEDAGLEALLAAVDGAGQQVRRSSAACPRHRPPAIALAR